MSKRTQFLVLATLAALSLGAFYTVLEKTVTPMQAGGPTVNSNGWVQILITAVSSAGFSWAAVATAVKEGINLLPVSSLFKSRANDALDVTQIVLYQQIYAKSTDPDEQAKIKEAVKIDLDNLIDEWFPDPKATS